MASRTPLFDRTLPGGLSDWIAEQRWFASKRRRIVALDAADRVPLGPGSLWIVRVRLDDGTEDRYAVPLLEGPGIRDALDEPGFCAGLLDLIAREARVRGGAGAVVATRTRAFPDGLTAPGRRLRGEQSNTSVVFGDALILKHFRRLALGPNPDVEVTRFLTERTDFRHTPRLGGSLEYRDGAGSAAVAMAQELVRGGQDSWRWLLDRLAAGDEALAPLRGLGRRTAELHRALGADRGDPDFAPEPITAADVEAWTAAVQRQLEAARRALGGARAGEVPARIDAAGLGGLVGAVKQRHHGDLHLGQTLIEPASGEMAIIDFEGEPLRPLAERRRKHTPLRDVAGLLRSLGYAAASAPAPPGWEERARAALLEGYRAAAGAAPFLPRAEADFARAVAVLEVEKAAYEVVYEADNRPDWITIPLGGVIRAARALTA
jgi:trehalose synthase-fused probable maltokinase